MTAGSTLYPRPVQPLQNMSSASSLINKDIANTTYKLKYLCISNKASKLATATQIHRRWTERGSIMTPTVTEQQGLHTFTSPKSY